MNIANVLNQLSFYELSATDDLVKNENCFFINIPSGKPYFVGQTSN